jgi:DNA-binding NtrC family response regulator
VKSVQKKLRVLFVDDDKNVRTTWAYCFGEAFDATVVESGEAALKLLAKPPGGRPFDVLVTDHRMPGMTGAELCREAARVAPATARVVITAFKDADARLCPCRRWLEKPLEPDRMERMIREAANGTVPAGEAREREREAEQARDAARADFREETAKLLSWEPPTFASRAKA